MKESLRRSPWKMCLYVGWWAWHGTEVAQQGQQSRSRIACTAGENKGKLAPSGTFYHSLHLTAMTREE